MLTKERYIKRNDRACALLRFNIRKDIGVQFGNEHWHDHIPKSVETNQGKFTILSKQKVKTDRNIPNNKSDIIIRDNEKVTLMLIDDIISGDRNVIKKEAEKILKYSDFIIEIEHMWNIKAKVTPVIGATGTI